MKQLREVLARGGLWQQHSSLDCTFGHIQRLSVLCPDELHSEDQTSQVGPNFQDVESSFTQHEPGERIDSRHKHPASLHTSRLVLELLGAGPSHFKEGQSL
eukprot:TRINITY_DN85054_c0_g1_i1.p1 TRINITY_DN85054_c0_g1~~TRINITY_DN85054_c0_g1_i1.p1  ORF type:complete len:101 (+),score=19.15 TRINITY_DN85054_c0_g1_i1:96-398(+)